MVVVNRMPDLFLMVGTVNPKGLKKIKLSSNTVPSIENTSTSMQQFLETVDVVESTFLEFDDTAQSMEEENIAYLKSISRDESNNLRTRITRTGILQSKRLLAARAVVDALEMENASIRKHKLGDGSSYLIRYNIVHALKRKINKRAKVLSNIQIRHSTAVDSKTCVFDSISDMENCMGSVNESKNVQSDMKLQAYHEYMPDEFKAQEMQERSKDLLEVEKNIGRLHETFVDMASIVVANGEVLDSIEYAVNQADAHITGVFHELQRVQKYQMKKNKRAMRWSGVLLAAVIVVVLCIVFAKT